MSEETNTPETAAPTPPPEAVDPSATAERDPLSFDLEAIRNRVVGVVRTIGAEGLRAAYGSVRDSIRDRVYTDGRFGDTRSEASSVVTVTGRGIASEVGRGVSAGADRVVKGVGDTVDSARKRVDAHRDRTGKLFEELITAPRLGISESAFSGREPGEKRVGKFSRMDKIMEGLIAENEALPPAERRSQKELAAAANITYIDFLYTRFAPQMAARGRQQVGRIDSQTHQLGRALDRETRTETTRQAEIAAIEAIPAAEFGGANAKDYMLSQLQPTRRHLATRPSVAPEKDLADAVRIAIPESGTHKVAAAFGLAKPHAAKVEDIVTRQRAKVGLGPKLPAAKAAKDDRPVHTVLLSRDVLRTDPEILRAKATNDDEAYRKRMSELGPMVGFRTKRDLLADESIHPGATVNLTAAEAEIAAKEKRDLDKKIGDSKRADSNRMRDAFADALRMVAEEREDDDETETPIPRPRLRVVRDPVEDAPEEPPTEPPTQESDDTDKIESEEQVSWDEYGTGKAWENQEGYRYNKPISKHDVKP